MKTDRYMIWSHEHGAWWMPNSSGYTSDAAQAGRYSYDEAAEIVMDVVPPGIEVAVDERFHQHGVYGQVSRA